MRLTSSTALDPVTLRAALDLAHAARHVDGVSALSEHALLHLQHHHSHSGDLTSYVVTDGGGEVVGFALLDASDPAGAPTAEIVVRPDRRRQGVATALLTELTRMPPDGLHLWAHGSHPGADELARRFGFQRVRDLWQMRLDLSAPLPDPVVPQGVALRTFEAERDDGAWLALNARAFASHPEQGSWSAHDLELRLASEWYDAAGFFIAERDDEGGARMVGFHWTKRHSEEVGEVYVVGVDPGEQGNGLGRALTLIGLRHLRGAGVRTCILYVDATNAAAIAVYQRLGFQRHHIDVCFELAPAG